MEIKGNWQAEALYHKHWLQQIKKKTKARHVVFVNDKGVDYIHAHFNNESGGTDVIKYELDGKPSELRDFDYTSLIEGLNGRENK